MIGSNSTALRQHAYSVFTASRRERDTSDDLPASVLRPSSERVAEPKSSGVAPVVGGVVHALAKPVPTRPAITREPARPAEAPSQDEIRKRAHQIFEARNGRAGDPVADWLQAEAELRQERGLA